ncbi:Epimerase family protein [Sodalis glossinidius str. 'morsitans']|uniref:Epimerase family protein n=1 Tax=Sodalis glossinidius (strain morsitans) TaxID=343509 RepID=Q2NSJ0_SODGM|nr:TIGR01777 family oxidoreductase [Sodalis glossinidius]BAE74885.1 putative sugar nucleotide epimerase [Sodalis glossinidius str. 'morsitans']CRL45731.1 Epimerase family protein [Sodalis glossinidius str. 'morsitans']
MKILLTGGTGLIGRHLVMRLQTLSHHVTVLTRDTQRAQQTLGPEIATMTTLAPLSHLNEFDAVINLAGEPIAERRWTDEQKNKLCQSRWDVTGQLSLLIRQSENPPSVFISSSATGYYGDQDDALVDEDEPPIIDFAHTLCARWEDLALRARSEKTRVCLSRTGVVLAADGGLLGRLLPLYKVGLGGPIGDGTQFMSWIHIDDIVNALLFMLTTDGLAGPFNVCSPYPVRNEHFSSVLAGVLHRPVFTRVPARAVQLFLGEGASLILGGQRAMPRRLTEAGFTFCYSELEAALTEIVNAV